jgi:hypothetical protein
LGGGPPGFRQGFTCPVLLGIPLGFVRISCTGLSPSVTGLSRPFHYPFKIPCQGPATPSRKRDGLGCSAFARHYLRNHYCFLFLRVLRCFTSPGIALKPYFIQTPVAEHYPGWVSPFGNLRIIACVPLPEAYRSLPRPSSPSGAKASTMCPYILDQKITFGHPYKRLPNHPANRIILLNLGRSCLPYSMQLSKIKFSTRRSRVEH